jgi:hypothetical protein
LEGYREDQHGPCPRMKRKIMKVPQKNLLNLKFLHPPSYFPKYGSQYLDNAHSFKPEAILPNFHIFIFGFLLLSLANLKYRQYFLILNTQAYQQKTEKNLCFTKKKTPVSENMGAKRLSSRKILIKIVISKFLL